MQGSSTGEIVQENLQSRSLSGATTKKAGARVHILWLLLLSSLVFFSCSYLTGLIDSPTGDEPHYLVISQTLLLYHSLDVNQDYAHGDYRSFYGGPLSSFQHVSLNKWGEQLPLHSIGAPILWLVPFAIAGRLGTLFFMSFISVLIIANIYLLLVSLGIRRSYAFFTCVGIILASPIWVFSHHDFVEPIAAMLCVYVVRVLFQERLRTLDLLASSLALSVLPWLHIRFALFEIVLFCFLLLRVYQKYHFKKAKPYLAALLPVCGVFLIFEAYNFFVWGSLSPVINQASSGEVPFDTAPWRGLLGLFLAQEAGLLTNFPIFLFLFGGIILACKKRFLRFNMLMLFLTLPYLATIASFHNWDGAVSPPARLITVLLPPLVFYLALALQSARSWIVNGLFLLFMSVTMLYEGVSFTISGGWIDHEQGYSMPLLLIAQALHLPLTKGVPTFFTKGKPTFPLPTQAVAFTGWLIFLGGLTLLVIVLARRQNQYVLPAVNDNLQAVQSGR
jgi:hypothetical protein